MYMRRAVILVCRTMHQETVCFSHNSLVCTAVCCSCYVRCLLLLLLLLIMQRSWILFICSRTFRLLASEFKYYIIKLLKASHTFGNKVKIIRHFQYEFTSKHVAAVQYSCTALSVSFLLWCTVCILLVSTYAACAKIEYVIIRNMVGFKPYLKDQRVSFSALTLLVWSYDL